ncbi:MAG TPA: DUF1097 domain-containing protein [Gemmatimonadales bacterium]|nr:DUF1097 domain-containing protein [Gemmatimonadales bacterium]
MNTMTTRALMVGLLIALWAWLADVSRLHLALWAGVVALGCFYAAGGGVPALQKTIVAALSGVVWVLIYHAVRVSIGARGVVGAVLLGAMACALALQSRVPFLSFTAAAFAGAGVALGLGVNTVNEAIRAGVALAVGAAIGFAAERAAGMIRTRGA